MTDATVTKPLTGMIDNPNELIGIDQYEKLGGYQAIRKAIGKMQPGEITKLVTDSGLKGRGGAGFSTGVKWSLIPMGPDAPKPKYLVCNADEMEPGTFKDRLLLECNPHQLIEGMILAAFAIQAEHSYIFIRGEYKLAEKRVNQALKEAEAKGYLGKNILGSGFNLEMHVHTSAGRYMCGEETGLLNSLEGKRANPRSKPPFPQISGLWGKPTIVNNVETLSNIPHIVNNGAAWFKGLSKSEDSGTKIYGVSGKVKKPGLWELPLGTTIGEIMDLAGGMKDGVKFKGLLPGGASTDFLVEQHFNVKMDYKSVAAAGSRLGTGTMIVLDDKTCPIGMILNLEVFFARESCGWCTPCREGLPWTAKVLQALEDGHGIAADLHRLDLHCRLLGPGKTFCALAPGAMEPLQSGLKYFKEDFDYHIREKHCPWK